MSYGNCGHSYHRSSYKVNEDDVPESKHTIFIRGLPAHVSFESIKDFFEEKIGPCSFDFQKVNQDRNLLFVAVRFETREAAKEAYYKFREEDVLGHRVEVTWFRDIRRFVNYQSQRGSERTGGRAVNNGQINRYTPRNGGAVRRSNYGGGYGERYERNSDSRKRRYSDENRRRSRSRSSRSDSRSSSHSDRSERSGKDSAKGVHSRSSSRGSGGEQDEKEREREGERGRESSDEEREERRRRKKEKKMKRKRARRSNSTSGSEGEGKGEQSAEEGELPTAEKNGKASRTSSATGTAAPVSVASQSLTEQSPQLPRRTEDENGSSAFSPRASPPLQHSAPMRITITNRAALSSSSLHTPNSSSQETPLPPPPPAPVFSAKFKVSLDSDDPPSRIDPPPQLPKIEVAPVFQSDQHSNKEAENGGNGPPLGSWAPVEKKGEGASLSAASLPPSAPPPPVLLTAPLHLAPTRSAESLQTIPPRAPPTRPPAGAAPLPPPPRLPPRTPGKAAEFSRLISDLKSIQDRVMSTVRAENDSLRLSSLAMAKEEDAVEKMTEREKLVASLSEQQRERFYLKKKQLENSYRGDCETFGIVSRALLGKDPSLESNLRGALLEALEDLEKQFFTKLDAYLEVLIYSS